MKCLSSSILFTVVSMLTLIVFLLPSQNVEARNLQKKQRLIQNRIFDDNGAQTEPAASNSSGFFSIIIIVIVIAVVICFLIGTRNVWLKFFKKATDVNAIKDVASSATSGVSSLTDKVTDTLPTIKKGLGNAVAATISGAKEVTAAMQTGANLAMDKAKVVGSAVNTGAQVAVDKAKEVGSATLDKAKEVGSATLDKAKEISTSTSK